MSRWNNFHFSVWSFLEQFRRSNVICILHLCFSALAIVYLWSVFKVHFGAYISSLYIKKGKFKLIYYSYQDWNKFLLCPKKINIIENNTFLTKLLSLNSQRFVTTVYSHGDIQVSVKVVSVHNVYTCVYLIYVNYFCTYNTYMVLLSLHMNSLEL